MSMDSQGYSSQPSYVYVMWLLLTCCQSSCVKIVGHSNLGIASAGAAGLKELMRVLQATMQACPFWDFAIPFGWNGSMVLTF